MTAVTAWLYASGQLPEGPTRDTTVFMCLLRHFLLSFCCPGCMIQPGNLHGVVKKRTWMLCMEEITSERQSRNEKAVAEDWPSVPAQLWMQSHNLFKPTENVISSPPHHWGQNFILLHARTGAQGVQRQLQGGMELVGSRTFSSGFIFSRVWPTAEQPKRWWEWEEGCLSKGSLH